MNHEQHTGIEYLTKPGKIGRLELKNRMVMSPMGTCLADPVGGGSVSDRLIDYYAERAKGGVGLIEVENTLVTPPEKYGAQGACQLMLYHRRFLPGWARLTEAVHEWGAKIAVQINYPGGGIDPAVEIGVQAVTASPFALPGYIRPSVSRGATIDDIKYIVDQYVLGAQIAKDADFDAVEIHCVHGYGIAGFQSGHMNQRNDLYGGTFRNRMRFGLEIIGRIKECIGDDYPIWCRIPADEFLPPPGVDREEGIKIAQAYAAAGVHAISLSCGGPINHTIQPKYYPRCYLESYCEAIKRAIDIPVMVAGSFNNPEDAERVLREGKVDFVVIGRGLIADPEYPKKVIEGRIDDIRKCLRCNEGCISTLLVKSHGINCAVNFEAGNEVRHRMTLTGNRKNVLVVGGGPAGMEAARVAASRGHKVTLCEKSSELGGHLIPTSRPDFKEEHRWLIKWFTIQLGKLGITVELDKEVTKEDVMKIKPDVVVIATGSVPVIPDDIVGAERAITVHDALLGEKKVGDKVVIVGGNLIGCETALHLAKNVSKITVIEKLDDILQDTDIMINRTVLLKGLQENGINVLTKMKLLEIGEKEVTCINSKWETIKFEADTVIIASERKSVNSLTKVLQGRIPEVYAIGDCVEPRNLMKAIHDGSLCARRI